MDEMLNATRSTLVFTGLVFASVAMAANTLLSLGTLVFVSSEYSYILVVIPISAALIWRDRDFIFTRAPDEIPRSLLLAGLLAVFMLGFDLRLGSAQADKALSTSALLLVTFWVASFWVCFGSDAIRKALFPLLFLLLLVPLPGPLMEKSVEYLQHASADAAALLFRIAGIPVFRHGETFVLINQQIEVARECSGIRSASFLIMSSLVFGHLFLRTSGSKLLVLAFALPVTIAKNGLRIFSLSVLSAYVSPAYLAGPLHRNGGAVFFVPALLLLALTIVLLSKIEKRFGTLRPSPTPAHTAAQG